VTVDSFKSATQLGEPSQLLQELMTKWGVAAHQPLNVTEIELCQLMDALDPALEKLVHLHGTYTINQKQLFA
jgi:hypothetical protein